MNIELLQRVRDAIASETVTINGKTVGFDMRVYVLGSVAECDVIACIAGYAMILTNPEIYLGDHELMTDEVETQYLMAKLDMPLDTLNELMFANKLRSQCRGYGLENINRDMAVRVLDHLISTGEVNWIKAIDGEY